MNERILLYVSLFALLAIPHSASAADPTDTTVVATVGDDPIEASEVKQLMDLIPVARRPTGDLLAMAQAQMLEEIVNRRLVVAYAQRSGDAPSAEALAKAKKQLQLRLSAQGRKAPNGQAEQAADAELDRQVLWRLIWDRYLAKYRTPERRKAWFQSHHRDVDGTELVVSHILLRPDSTAGPKDLEALEKQAAAIRAEITSGKTEFAQAAAKYSGGPSGKQGGRLGKIGRHGPMDEAFSRAAFELEKGQISPPIRSPFGIHLICCDEVVPGSKQISEVAAAIDDALAQELLTRIAGIEREKTAVKYTEAWPHFKPGTQELAK